MTWTNEDAEVIFQIAENLTGSCQKGSFRKDILITNVKRRMEELGVASLTQYFQIAMSEPSEKDELLAALTIHTTSWFREQPHFKLIFDLVSKMTSRDFKAQPFLAWSAACSSGEEIYSIALCLEKWKSMNPHFEYKIYASDLDPKSVRSVQKGLYSRSQMESIPKEYWPWLLVGKDDYAQKFTLCKDIRSRLTTFQFNLAADATPAVVDFDLIFCRNVLIYFDSETVQKILANLAGCLQSEGTLVLGHSEAMAGNHPKLESLKSSAFKRKDSGSVASKGQTPKMLVVDESYSVRRTIARVGTEKGFQVVEAESFNEAKFKLENEKFDLITLDLNPRGKAGMIWLEELRRDGLKTPVVIISDASPGDAIKVFGALELGAEEYFTKSSLTGPDKLFHNYLDMFVERVGLKKYGSRNSKLKVFNFSRFKPELILIGASTGGPDAIWSLLKSFPKPCPPIVVVQHISNEFMRPFAERVAMSAGLTLVCQTNEAALQPNHIYLPCKDEHLLLKKSRDGKLSVFHEPGEKHCGHRPSVSKLFASAASLSIHGVAVLLTGMGSDGADGMKKLAETDKFYTLAQDEASCVVYGMPKVARDLGAVCFVGNLLELRNELETRLHLRNQEVA